MNYSHLLLKEALSPLSLLIYFKNIDRIQNKLVLEEQKSGCDDDSVK